MFNFPLHLEFSLNFRNIWFLKNPWTSKYIVFHEKQKKIQSALLDGG